MKRLSFVFLFVLFAVGMLFSNAISDSSIEVLATALSALNADFALGTPVTVGENIVLPIFKAKASFLAGSGGPGKTYGSGVGGEVSLLPYALAFISEEGIQVVPISNEKPLIEQLTDALPKIMPYIQEVLMAFLLSPDPVRVTETIQDPIESSELPTNIVEQEIAAVPTEHTSLLGLCLLFSTFQNELLEALQDGLSYFLIKEESLKEEYSKNFSDVEQTLLLLESMISSDPVLQTEHYANQLNYLKEQLLTVKNEMERLFKLFANEEPITKEEFVTAYSKIDSIRNVIEMMSEMMFNKMREDEGFPESIMQDYPKGGNMFMSAFYLSALEADIFDFVEGVYGYLLSKDEAVRSRLTEEIGEGKQLTVQLEKFAQESGAMDQHSSEPFMLRIASMFQNVNALVESGFFLVEGYKETDTVDSAKVKEFKILVDIYSGFADEIATTLMSWLEQNFDK